MDKLLYTKISSSVTVNGHICLQFPIKRSFRRGCGCAISMLLYVLSMEPIAHKSKSKKSKIFLFIVGTL